MGRLIEIDVDKLKELLNDNKIELTNNIISVVRENYIPKDEYETRLKADMVAMLTELQLEIEDLYPEHQCTGELTGFADAIETITPIIQQKIDTLEAESEED